MSSLHPQSENLDNRRKTQQPIYLEDGEVIEPGTSCIIHGNEYIIFEAGESQPCGWNYWRVVWRQWTGFLTHANRNKIYNISPSLRNFMKIICKSIQIMPNNSAQLLSALLDTNIDAFNMAEPDTPNISMLLLFL